MRKCPGCRSEMAIVAIADMQIDACRSCGGFWFDCGELEPFTGREAVQRVIASARKGEGVCKGCGGPVEAGLRECVTCGHAITECPECGARPLLVGNVRGINVDVCTRCEGIFLDTGELQLLAKDTGFAARLQQAALEAPKPAGSTPTPNRVDCVVCGRTLRAAHAFEYEREYYCGTCAPAGATPVVPKLTRQTSPHETIGLGHHHHHHVGEIHIGGDEIAGFFSWLFSRD